MLAINNILFPTDFTAHAERAFSHAAHLAVQYDAEVHVLNVRAPHKPEEAKEDPTVYLPLERREKSELLYLAADARPDVHVHYQQLRRVSPVMGILEYADEVEADLIVMGTRGQRGVDRLADNSVTEEVVRLAGCPTFTVRTGEGPVPARLVRRILVPVDFSEPARMQVAHARALASVYGAEVDLLHVIEETSLPKAYGIQTDLPIPEVKERTRRALRALAEEAGPFDEEPNIQVVADGPSPAVILDVAEEREADLIVMATHGRTGLDRFLIGSVTEKVVRQAPCPVFTVRTFGKSLLTASDGGEEEQLEGEEAVS